MVEVAGVLRATRRKPAAVVTVTLGPMTTTFEVVARRFGVLALRAPHGAGGVPAATVSADLRQRSSRPPGRIFPDAIPPDRNARLGARARADQTFAQYAQIGAREGLANAIARSALRSLANLARTYQFDR